VSSGLAATAEAVEDRPRRTRRFWMLIALVTMPVLALDQLSKLYIRSHFRLYETVPIVPNWLDVTYTLNPGAAFSLFATMPAGFRSVFFIVLSIAAIIVLGALLARSATSLASSISFALILGGTIGNLIDRLARSVVIDFIYFHHNSFSYPVFNVADSAITVGVAIILLFSVMGDHQSGEKAA
jgi:signal peptidase II